MTEFEIIWHKCSLSDPLPKLFKWFWLLGKHGVLRAGPVLPMRPKSTSKIFFLIRPSLEKFGTNVPLVNLGSSGPAPSLICFRTYASKMGNTSRNHLVRNYFASLEIFLHRCSLVDHLLTLCKLWPRVEYGTVLAPVVTCIYRIFLSETNGPIQK